MFKPPVLNDFEKSSSNQTFALSFTCHDLLTSIVFCLNCQEITLNQENEHSESL